jgi:5-oxoprolinase (ATP-hydrolysing) subunit C
MSLEIIELYGVGTLQSEPKPGRRKYGVPPGGAFDLESMSLANTLVGNDWRSATLELGLASITMRADRGMRVSVVGAASEIRVDDGERPVNSAFSIVKGQVLKIAPPRQGCRLYLASTGGFAAIGAVGKGAVLVTNDAPYREPSKLADQPQSMRPRPLRVVPGPQVSHFDLRSLTNAEFRVTAAADRTGIRLAGPSLGSTEELVSEPACIGAIQVTKDGQPIIIGPDGPTIGGYPKIAVVIRADRDRVGQLAPGDAVQFELTTIEEARRLRLERLRRLIEAADQLRLGRVAEEERGRPASPIDL